jgi:hypothetical protein
MSRENPDLKGNGTRLRNLAAQRLVAQPLGRARHLVNILAGILKPYFGVHTFSLGQVG